MTRPTQPGRTPWLRSPSCSSSPATWISQGPVSIVQLFAISAHPYDIGYYQCPCAGIMGDYYTPGHSAMEIILPKWYNIPTEGCIILSEGCLYDLRIQCHPKIKWWWHCIDWMINCSILLSKIPFCWYLANFQWICDLNVYSCQD